MKPKKIVVGRAFGSESRLTQVRKRVIGAIVAIETSPRISEAEAAKMAKIEGTNIVVTSAAIEEVKIEAAIGRVDTRGVEIRLNGRLIATAPDRAEHVAARSFRASRPPAPPPDAA